MDYDQFAQQLASGGTPSAAPAPAPANSDNPYDQFAMSLRNQTQQVATGNLIAAQDSNPDQAARALKLAPQVGVPAPAVEQDLPEYEKQAQLVRNRQQMVDNPFLAEWVASNPDSARIAQDDFDKLGLISKITTALKSGAMQALDQNELGRLYNTKQLAGLTGGATPGTDAQIQQQERALAAQPQLHGMLGGVQQLSGFATGLLDNFLHAQQMGVAGAAAGAVIGAPEGGVGALPGAALGATVGLGIGFKADMARVQAGMTYRALENVQDKEGQPLDETGKQIGALLSGALTYGLAGAGGAMISKVANEALSPFISEAVSSAMTRPTVAMAVRNFAAAAVKGGISGAALNAGMEVASIAGQELAKQISPGDFNTVFNDQKTRSEALQRLADAAESGALLFGGIHSAGALVGLTGDIMRARQSSADIAMFQQLQDGAADSLTRGRSVDAFQQFLQSQTDGSPVENIYIPAERIQQLYQSHGAEPGASDPLFGFVPDMQKQMQEALPIGGDVVIPTSDYIAHMAGTDVSRELLPDIRVRQDGMSVNDVQRFMQSSDLNLRRDAQALAGMEDPVRQIFDDVNRQALESGYSQGASQQYAALYAARYATRAARLGLDPMDLYRQSGVELRVAGEPTEEGSQLAQDHENARGAINLSEGKAIIELFKGRDMSTLLHESGHLWLEEMRADAERPDAPQQLKDDLGTITKWMGVDDASKIDVEHHEQFARAAEAYFMEGKAPSGALASAFRAFKSWLVNIYRNVSALNTPINDDIRGVLDRMLATDDEIQEAQRSQGLRASFRDPTEAGMTEREFAEYQKTVERAGAAADGDLLNKVMEHVRRKRTTDYEAYRARVKEEVTRDVDSRPDFQAIEALRGGALDDGNGGSIKLQKLSAQDIDRAYGAGTSERMPRGTTVKRGGAHPDDMADLLGFGSGDEMVKALTAIEQQERDIRQTPGERRTARQYIIDRRTDFRMSEEQPDILSDGSIRDAALEAIHNQEMQKALQIEMRALGRRIHQEAFSLEDARRWAKDTIDGKTVRDVQLTGKYSRAEAKAARMVEQALLDGDAAAAFTYKRQQVLNHHLFVAAREASEEIQSASKELNRYASKRTIPGLSQEYLDQIHALLDRFDFGDASQKEIARRKSLRDWAARQEANGQEVTIAPELLNDAYSKHFSEMTVSEFRGLKDAVDNIAHLGKLKQTLLDGADERDFDAVVNEAVNQTEKLPKRAIPTARNPGEGGRGLDRISAKWLNAKSSLRSLDASMLKMEQVFDWLDSGDERGVFNRVVFRRLADAGTMESDLRSYMVSELRALHDKLPEGATKDWLNRYELPELTDSRTGEPSRMLKKDIIAMALNVGNDSNFEKLLRGEGWNRQAVWAVLNRHMTKADWDFVQGSWDLIETLWPKIEAMEKRLSGVAPEKIRPTAVRTPFGEYRGGYYPAIYDPLRAYDVELNRQRSGDRLFENNYTRAMTDKGHTIERIQDYARPLYLNLDVLPRHLTGVIHDLAYREAIIDADRFLSDERVRESVETTLGREVYMQFRPWLQAIANDRVYDQRGLAWWDRAAHWARTSSTMVGLGFRATTMMIHGMTALSNSIGEIGPRWMMSGVQAFDTPSKWAATRDFVFERSGEMRNRMNEVDRDVRDALREMEVASDRNPAQKVYDTARRFAYYGISMLDMGSAMPTWVGAYNKALHEGMSEEDAVYSADKAVRNAHGGGGSKDLAAIQRGTEFQKLFTMFYSFWNHFYNRQRDIGRRAVQAGQLVSQGEYKAAARDFAMVAARSWFYFVLPQLIHAAIKPAPANQEQESWPAWAAKEIGLGLFSGVPVLRDIANSAATGRGYSATPAAQMVDTFIRSGRDLASATGLSDQPVSDKWVKHAVQTAGYVFGLPTGQLSNAGQFLWDVIDGEQQPKDVQDWLHGVVYGKTQ
ncbi:hypothetical protein [Paraburkholderia kururiensis]|uniref:hypothetical protein n=1 Tax=Paraburkholderia kururiensis TaxID=984307 RepID=UPI0003465404|nr:hypothetical protein [Paraburkholderia kururiensis]